ncbi:DegT/DnrJ/EryC1/StrS family aminotransferase [Corynebacterium aurimucosum]|uniref:DegT/DnrJ/EryC1/StrS family aminotransferase n=1 Tax=Corynebacterium aurimucosum TaxID=169292 RepID=A0A558IQJ5_9CORY|nr:DegT/DnrJ/EryC1/StrS family aminotransferase [Corynebacterium aurimucosum]TVU83636.1 DegT/DnrJ/EryC1/StrS family aminotransferase [Corynebacterium aurimucosum]
MTDKSFIPAAKPIVGDEEREAVDRVLLSGMIAQGPETSRFEEEFSQDALNGVPGVTVNSGTSALHLGLLAAGIGPGDEVIVPSFTFAATANSVAATGAKPVFADIDEYFTLDPKDVETRITDRTKAIMPVHLYGHPANMEGLLGLAQKHDVLLLEDCAQAHMATWDGKFVGTMGLFGAFSFYPTKNMTSAEGGFVSSKDEEFLRRVRLYRNQGMEERYRNEVVGYNNRMTDVHAAIGRVQLKKLPGWTATRQKNAEFLSTNITGVEVPKVHEKATHVYHQYTIRIAEDRDGFMRALRDEYQIGSGVYYPIPNHELESLKHFAEGLALPETAVAAKECLSLPVYPTLSENDLERIVNAVNELAKAGA